MKKKTIVTLIVILALVANVTPAFADKPTGFDEKGNATGQVNDNGFDQWGYNSTARIFSGFASGWCLERGAPADCMGNYSNDRLVMKWNAEWDRGNDENWSNPPYDAWENNEWNGAFPGGSGAVWHYKIVWVGDCVLNPDLVPAAGYCVWGQFATIMDQGTDPSYGPGHLWFAHANPTGYGSYP
jgi:hypothetical protein